MSFKPSTFAVGGGLLDDVDVVVKEAKITMFDYNGTRPDAVPSIEFTLGVKDGEDMIQNWTVGKSSDWMPSEDGKKLVGIGKATQINANSNGAILLKSIVDAGFPETKIADSIDCFAGMEGHVMRVPAPKRNMAAKAPRADGKVYEDTILTFASITKLPWEAKAKAAAGKVPAAKATTKPAPAPEPAQEDGGEVEEGSLEERVQGLLLEILSENPSGVKKQALPGLIFKKVGATDPDRAPMLQIAFRDEFLKSGPWTYDKGIISLS